MDIKSLLDKFIKKSDDSMIMSDPFDDNIQESSSKFSSFFNFIRMKNKDASQETHVIDTVPITDGDADKKRSQMITNVSLLCVLAAIIGIGAYLYNNSKDKEHTSSTFQSATGKTSKKDIAENPANPNEVKVAYGNVMINPFVDLGEMRKNAKQGESVVKVASVPAPVRSYDNENSLPAIPSFNPPSQPSSIPKVNRVAELPAPIGGRKTDGSVPQQSGPVEVQGILMGNDGSSMAILSDGSVVETGDTYKDGRIAYIGGDGIKFDDGSSMQFKE